MDLGKELEFLHPFSVACAKVSIDKKQIKYFKYLIPAIRSLYDNICDDDYFFSPLGDWRDSDHCTIYSALVKTFTERRSPSHIVNACNLLALYVKEIDDMFRRKYSGNNRYYYNYDYCSRYNIKGFIKFIHKLILSRFSREFFVSFMKELLLPGIEGDEYNGEYFIQFLEKWDEETMSDLHARYVYYREVLDM